MIVLADTGAVLGLLKRDDVWHERVVGFWESAAAEIRLPEPILAEVCYLLGRQVGQRAEAAFVRAVADGEFLLEDLEASEDVPRAADLLQTYHDVPLGFVDAAVAAIAERIGATTILTTDRRHFPVIRPRHVPAFVLRP